MVCLLFHFRIFFSMNGAEEVARMDHKLCSFGPKGMLISLCGHLPCLLNSIAISFFFLWTGWPYRNFCIPTNYLNLLLIQFALSFTAALMLISLFWTVTNKKIHILTFIPTAQNEPHRHSGLPFLEMPVEYIR